MQEPSWVLTLRGQGELQSCCVGSRAHWSDLDVDLPPLPSPQQGAGQSLCVSWHQAVALLCLLQCQQGLLI